MRTLVRGIAQIGGFGPHRISAGLVAMVVIAGSSGCGLDFGETGLACQEPPAPAVILGNREVPDIEGMTPAAAAASLEQSEIEPSWRYTYSTQAGSRTSGYSECWCEPPPDGVVEMVAAEPNEQLVVFVERSGPIVGGRPQPQLGWGCDAEA